MRDPGAILLDMNPDRRMAESVRHAIEDRGDKVVDLHVWRVDPGHMSAVVSAATSESQRDSRFNHALLERFKGLLHVTVAVQRCQRNGMTRFTGVRLQQTRLSGTTRPSITSFVRSCASW